jgi:PAS domain S-box-containing protein
MARILIADDEKTIRMLMQKLLQSLGFEVAGAAVDGMQALELAKTLRPDLVLMDIVMPGAMDGIDAAKKILAEFDIPVIFLTGYGGEEIIDRAKCAEPYAYLVKPCAEEEVKAAIELALDRKRRDRDRQESVSCQRTLTAAIPHTFRVYSGDYGRLLYVSKAYEKMWGLSRESLYQAPLSFLDAIHPDDRPDVLAGIEGQKRGEASEKIYRIAAPGSDIRWIRDSAFPIRDAQGRVQQIAGIAEDITAQHILQQSLIEAETRYRTVADNTFDWEFWVDPEGRFLYNSPSAERVTGYRPEEFEQDAGIFLRMIHPADRELFQGHYQQADMQKKPGRAVFRVLRRDGTERWIEHICNPVFSPGGRYLGSRGSNRDITEQRMAEEERRALAERLQRAEKMEAVGTLAGGVAHDLNNILGILVGSAELLLDDIPPGSALREDVQNILRSGQRAAAIIQDLLTLARRGIASSEVIDLNEVIDSVLSAPGFGDLKERHPGVRVHLQQEKALLYVLGSPVHLGKTVLNLAQNAAEAMPEGGDLTIETRNQYLDRPLSGYDDMSEGDYVVLAVSDTGQGISPEDRGRIFEPFYTKKKMGRSGTGLGLAVVWGTVKDHRGFINVQSEEGKGSTFSLYFPVTMREKTAHSRSVPRTDYLGRGETILVVDDVGEQRELVTRMLTKLGYRVSCAASGEEALDWLRNSRADLLVLDMIMDPGIDGLETYKRVLAIHPAQKAIIVSGFSETERVREAQSLGVGGYVRKPYVMEKIGAAIRRELDNPRAIPGPD